LTPDQQNVIQEAATASIIFEAELLKENTAKLRKIIKEKGMEIYHLPESEKESFRDIVEPVWQKYQAKFSDSLVSDFLDDLKKY
jgi:TRAP-type C4-dicarboxylate transport system substrate-binding protein